MRARPYNGGLYIAPLCIALALACWTAMPGFAEDASAKAPAASGIVTGMVKADTNTVRVGGRRVTAVNLVTGDRVTAITAGSGAYTLVLVPGQYRLDIDQASNEAVVRARSELSVGVSTLQEVDIRIGLRSHAPVSPRIYQPPLPTRAPIV